VYDSVSWTLREDSQYSAVLAYKAQFFGATSSEMKIVMWEIWATPKVKLFSWLALQNSICTADQLQKQSVWANCGICPRCKRNAKSIDHRFVHCRYTQRLQGVLNEWLDIYFINVHRWPTKSLKEWWLLMTGSSSQTKKASHPLSFSLPGIFGTKGMLESS
jgi:hypothetical protein